MTRAFDRRNRLLRPALPWGTPKGDLIFIDIKMIWCSRAQTEGIEWMTPN